MRKSAFQNDNFYHIYNRGVDKREIFLDKEDYVRFLVSMREFNLDEQIESLYRLQYLRKKAPKALLSSALGASNVGNLVEIIAYSLLSNHYHFLLKQKIDNGISKFMQKIGAGYTSYFNAKYNRTGSLFQGTYKAVELDSTDKISQISMYINGNSEVHGLAKAEKYPWSSYLDYLCERDGSLCNKDLVLSDFSSLDEYKNLCNMIIKETRAGRRELKEYILEK